MVACRPMRGKARGKMASLMPSAAARAASAVRRALPGWAEDRHVTWGPLWLIVHSSTGRPSRSRWRTFITSPNTNQTAATLLKAVAAAPGVKTSGSLTRPLQHRRPDQTGQHRRVG